MKIEKIKAIKNLVNSYYGIEVDRKVRTEVYVQARALAYTILRNECLMSYTFIGHGFKKNHATIMHAIKEFPYMMKFNKQLERDYHIILSRWHEEADEYDVLKPFQLKKELNNLREQNKMLNLSLINVQEELEKIKSNNKKYSSLVSLIDNRVPEQRLNEVEKKLNAIVNGI
jgi:hypothetical protein